MVIPRRYPCRVIGIHPPDSLRNLLLKSASWLSFAIACADLATATEYLEACRHLGTNPDEPPPHTLLAVAHQVACDLNNPLSEVERWDPADSYSYTVQVLTSDGAPVGKPYDTTSNRLLSVS